MFVHFQDATIQLGEREGFAHTNWRIETGQNWAIAGANGSGKTILSRALLRQLPLRSGKILYGFDDPAYPSGRPFFYPGEALLYSAETHRGFQNQYSTYYQARFQSFEGEEVPSVEQILDWRYLGARSRFDTGSKEPPGDYEQKRKDMVDLFQLTHLMKRSVHQLSHGESKKVFLARLLLRSPKLLVLDDPFTGLDESMRVRFRQVIDHLLKEHKGLIVLAGGRLSDLPASVTHLLTVANLQAVSAEEWDPKNIERKIGSCTEIPIIAPIKNDLQEKQTGYDSPELVDFKNVTVEYGGIRVLDEVNWLVRQGERWALVGPNGAGKSTLLSLILADHPQAYRMNISLFGRKRGSGESIWEIKRKIGWVSPELHIFYEPNIPCNEVVSSGFFDSVGLFRRCTPEQLHASARMLDSFGLNAVSDKPFQSVSAGQQRMVLLARALVKEPPLLVLDEPCQGLDDPHRREFLSLLDQVCAWSSITLIYVSHYQDELPGCITHHLRLESGVVVQAGQVKFH